MNIINSGTNTTVGTTHIPTGALEWPESGELHVILDNGQSNAVWCASGDTLAIDSTSITLINGFGVWEGITFGFALTFTLAATIGAGRWILRTLGFIQRD